MKQSSETIPVKGGLVTRESKSGRFVAVSTPKGVSKASAKSQSTVEMSSAKRSAALKRLSDR